MIDPALVEAAGELRAAIGAAVATQTGWATPEQIAGRIDLLATVTTLHGSLVAGVGLAYVTREIAADHPGLAAPARIIAMRAQGEAEVAIGQGETRFEGVRWVTPQQIAANQVIPLPEPARRGRVYAVRWVVERELSDRTRELYVGLLERQVLPSLGDVDLTLITPPRVRAWRQDLLDTGTGPSTVAKAYRLLRAVMNTAVDDEVISRNPCRIRGAGVEPTPERPVIGVDGVLALANAVPERYRTLILLATFGSLRWGELMGLRKSDIDLNEATVSIERSVVEVGNKFVVKEPKTAAGVRTIALPRSLMPEIARHLDRFSEAGPEGRMFIGPYGVTPARGNFARIWSRAKKEVGDLVPSDFHFHDLRHAGNHFAASSGVVLAS
jgi:integrase